MAIIYGLSSILGDPQHVPEVAEILLWVPPDLQNLLHIPLYAGLSWLWCRQLLKLSFALPVSIAISVVISTSFGILDEWHQSFIIGRYPSATDALFNLLGCIFGIIPYLKQLRRELFN